MEFIIITTVWREKLDFSETRYQSKVISGFGYLYIEQQPIGERGRGRKTDIL